MAVAEGAPKSMAIREVLQWKNGEERRANFYFDGY
jgi:hypothetical protein